MQVRLTECILCAMLLLTVAYGIHEKKGDNQCRARQIERFAVLVSTGRENESQSLTHMESPKSTFTIGKQYAISKVTDLLMKPDGVNLFVDDIPNGRKYYNGGCLL